MKLHALLLASLAFALAGCERAMHDMYAQPKYKPLAPSSLFNDGNSSRPQVPGTVPHSAGALAAASSGRINPATLVPSPGPALGIAPPSRSPARSGPAAALDYANPLPITPQLLARGRERFNIYCEPCHSSVGDGDGIIVHRGFPAPPNFHTDRLRNAPDSHFYKLISDGTDVMYSYADRTTPYDRWAIVAYIRALQLSQHVLASALGAQDRAALDGAAR